MQRYSVFRALFTIFMVSALLGGNHSFAMDYAPEGAPVSENEESEIVEPQVDTSVVPDDNDVSESTLPPASDTHTATTTNTPFDATLYTISGQVTYRDGTPHSNGNVPFPHDTILNGWTDDAGFYTISDVPNGNYQIGGSFGPGFGSDLYEVTVEDGDVVQNIVVSIAPVISGNVTDTDGNPVSAEVCYAGVCFEAENGWYQRVANRDEEIVVTVVHHGFVSQSKIIINDGPTAHHSLDFILERSNDGPITGYDPDEIITVCFVNLANMELGPYTGPIGDFLRLKDLRMIEVAPDGSIQPIGDSYFGDCDGRTPGSEKYIIVVDTDVNVVFCDLGKTYDLPYEEAKDYLEGRGSDYQPGQAGYVFELVDGITPGPCATDGETEEVDGDNGNEQDGGGDEGDQNGGETETLIIVQVILPGGVSVEGAEFGLYAPVASLLPPGAFHTGVVGPNNTFTLPELLPDTYRIVIAPADGELIEFNAVVGEDTIKLVIDLTEDEEADVDSPDAGMSSSGSDAGTSEVTGLPETGSGTGGQNIALWLAMAASVMMTAGAYLIRQNRT